MRKEELIKYRNEVLFALSQHEGDRDKPFLLVNRKTYSINDIIKEVENLTDFGLKQIRIWVNIQERVKQTLKDKK